MIMCKTINCDKPALDKNGTRRGAPIFCVECSTKDQKIGAYKRHRAKIGPKVARQRAMLYGAKMRAEKQGLPFNLEIDDIVIPENCPVLGIPLKLDNPNLLNDSPTLDKINPKLGYVKGNVAVISQRANRLKQDASIEEMYMIIEYAERNKLEGILHVA